jgi:formamidopyrimidine-DNA glycosylase
LTWKLPSQGAFVPELPEVETVVRELRPLLVGRRIRALRVSKKRLRSRWSPEWAKIASGRRVREALRRGKWILLDLEGDAYLVIHLGMTGQLTIKRAREPLELHTHLIADLDRGGNQLRFRDIRRFGSATLYTSTAELQKFFTESKLGPEPFDLDRAYWEACLSKTFRCLKAVLLDQRVVAGVGNIYADESLYEACLHPAQLGRQTNRSEADRLRRAIARVLRRAIDKRGSSIRNYVGGSGLKGEYQNEFRVYGQLGKPCRRCAGALARMRLAGRATHYCPACQRLPASSSNDLHGAGESA